MLNIKYIHNLYINQTPIYLNGERYIITYFINVKNGRKCVIIDNDKGERFEYKPKDFIKLLKENLAD